VHDLGLVFLDGQRVGFMDRRNGAFKVELPARQKTSVLDILVEAMGRVNFGKEVHDKKGLHGPVKIELSNGQSVQPNSWQIYNLPLDGTMLDRLRYAKHSDAGPAFW